MMKTTFTNKVVLITGGASGIGKIMGRKALERGASKLVIWDINAEGLKQIINEFSAYRDKILTVEVDVSRVESIQQGARYTSEVVGVPSVLINNAGIIVGKYFHEHSSQDIERTMRINTDALMHVTNAFLHAMMDIDDGAICNIASSAGLVSNSRMSVYAASKWAVIGWSDSLRLEMEELKRNIRVTTVMPFYIKTGMFDGVKSKLIPIMEPEKAAEKIIRAIERGKKMYALPMPLWFIRLAQGILPLALYDWTMRNVFGIYDTMKEFKGKG